MIYLTPKDYEKALMLSTHYNKVINYSDCLILATMEDEGINKIITFDKDFKKVKGLKCNRLIY